MLKEKFRGCANTPLTSTQLYSAATTIDLELCLHYIRHKYPSAPLHGVGFSLGASVLTNYLGNSSSSSLLSSGLALGCPWNLPGMSIRLEGDIFTRLIYSGAMATNVMRIFFRQYDHTPQVFDNDELFTRECVPRLKVMRRRKWGVRLKDVDEVMTSRLGGPLGEGLWPFSGAEAYYKYASPYQRVEAVKRSVG
jgi:predicted alpha/beta-fold hydrolase